MRILAIWDADDGSRGFVDGATCLGTCVKGERGGRGADVTSFNIHGRSLGAAR